MAALLAATLAAEGERCLLWAPVLLGAGIGVYFALPVEPAAPVLALAAVLSAVLAVVAVRAPPVRVLAVALALVLAGLVAAGVRTATVRGPALPGRIGPTYLSGRIVDVDRHRSGYRLVLDRLRVRGLARSETPRRIRITVPAGDAAPAAGTVVGVRAVLMPLPGPSLPDGFDFQRWAFFQGIGAVGFAYGPPRLRVERRGGWTPWLAALRADLDRRIERAYAGDGERAAVRGAVAIAMITGNRGGIPDDVNQAMRSSGLAHVLAISGHHVAVIGGFVFVLVRVALALVPWVALRWPIKKIAALCGFAAAFAYLYLSGASVPTQRAVIMLAVVTLAVLLDRFALSMRVAALAAMAILLVTPEMLVSPSFQLSFAAAIGLIAAYEAWRDRRARRGPRPAAGSRIKRAGWHGLAFFLAILATSAVASIATAPFAAFHFERLPVYGIVANVLAMPVVSLWIMPMVLFALVLLPLGLEQAALVPLGWGIDLFVAIAREVAGWPHAVVSAGGLGPVGLSLIALGGLWFVLWHGRWRWAGLPLALAASVPWLAGAPAPDVLIADGGRLVGFQEGRRVLWISSGRPSQFVADIWRQRLGVADVRPFPKPARAGGHGPLVCAADGCSWQAEERRVIWLRKPPAHGRRCLDGDVIIAGSGVPPAALRRLACPRGAIVVDRDVMASSGALTLRFEGDDVVMETAAEARGDRPWVLNSAERERPAAPAPAPERRRSAGWGRLGSPPPAARNRPPSGSA